ncbi:MAG: pyridoxamine 5'-phosphate oxidase family protein [Candidatus Omnitrophica bacterium]|nr:pyridoxamine 5'-phosphate oxidase family protein [Candidatus Omnitrophota bacterium]MBU1127740.1 pyridoxamine 5'-phosphate oxidase family protein [Candidatus Omnitrophota bacterium]MBU1783717.1 pyridoxamine 5'-phosphate oxidase family protein [Candidatus Omnitrophota bacterium]MBU1851764.1 pyridoxamine 5'-phosphate oxidase family protein [Candidatus Omnitrophota bacterium]
MNVPIIDNDLKAVLSNQKLGVLATTGEIYPYTSLVGFAVSEDLKNIIFATIKDTRKYQNCKKHPNVSVLVNSAANSKDDFKDATAVTALGESEDLIGEERKKYKSIYLGKFPFLEDFIENPNCVLVSINVERYIVVTRFQEVKEIKVG